MRRPTITDVARRAGVSVGTASNVLNNKDIVSEARRTKVLRAAEEIGYRVNGLARGLRQRRTNVVGLCTPATSSAFHASLAEAVETIAADRDQTLMQVMSHGKPELEFARVDALIQRRVDGIVIMPSPAPARTFRLLEESHTPTVIIERQAEGGRHFDSVTIDERAAMIAAASHLTAFGHRRILFLVRYPQLSVTSERIATIENLAEESRGALQPRIMAFGDDLDLFERSFPEALRGPDAPTAIIVSNSILALWVARALRRLGLSWPRDLSIVAFDEPIWGDLVTPGLTIVRQPIAQLAEVALDLLHERIAGVHMGGARHIVLEAELVSRGSTAPCPPDGVRPAP